MQTQASVSTLAHSFATIRFDQLVHLETGNARTIKTPGHRHDVRQVADTIAAQGLLQNLIVVPVDAPAKKRRKKAEGDFQKYGVAGGDTRFEGLELLHSEGKISDDYPVPVRIDEPQNAIIVSMTENIIRSRMHMADQCEGYAKTRAEGHSVEEVARIYAMPANDVRRGLKIASIAPELFQMFKGDKITLEQAIAFATSDDHAEQLRVWKNAKADWQRSPHHLRAALSATQVKSTSSIVRFIGLDEYIAAGGRTTDDLFSQNSETIVLDTDLVNKLAMAKLEEEAEKLREAGWLWVVADAHVTKAALNEYGTMSLAQREPTTAEAKRISATRVKMAEANQAIEANSGEDGDEDAYYRAQTALDKARQTLLNQMEKLKVYNDAAKEVSGVIVCIEDGQIAIHQGLIRESDKDVAKRVNNAIKRAAGNSADDDVKEKKAAPEYSERLTQNLTSHRTAAVQAVLASRPDVAMLVMTHRLALDVIYGSYWNTSAVRMRIETTYNDGFAPELPEAKASVEFAALGEAWRAKLPEDEATLYSWLTENPNEVPALFAFCVASGTNTMSGDCTKKEPHVSQLMTALNLNMADWWTPTKESLFIHMRKDMVAGIAANFLQDEAEIAKLHTLKRDELADKAEALVAGTGWVPSVFQP